MMARLAQQLQHHWRAGILGGSALLFLSNTLVNGGNYAFNLILGRWLGPAAFADVTLIVTLLLVARFVTIALQLTAVKFTAAFAADEATHKMAALTRWLRRYSWLLGILVGLLLAGGALIWQRVFNTESYWPFVILGVGLPIYLVQGTDRGILQGQLKLGRLSASYQAEMWTRLAASVVLVVLGFGVNGAVGAITLSFLATWLVARKVGDWIGEPGTLEESEKKTVVRYAAPVMIVYLGQILINNSDILLVKRMFDPVTAGQYSALALIGRIVFFATWSVVAVLFPLVAQKQQRHEPHRQILAFSLALVMAISGTIIAISWAFPDFIVQALFGPAYLSIAPLLWLYGLATAFYAMANVVVNYRLSLGEKKGTWLTLATGAAQVILIAAFGKDLQSVVLVQVILMGVFMVVTMAWDQYLALSERRNQSVKLQVGLSMMESSSQV